MPREKEREQVTYHVVRPLKGYNGKDRLEEIAAQIDAMYDDITRLVAERKGDPGLKAALLPLRKRLKRLKEQEADAMELRFRSQLQYDPQEGRRLIERAKRLLGK